MPILPTNYETLSAMITPALFLTANGSLIISTSNRMARLADRVRSLSETIDRLDRGLGDVDYIPDRIKLAESQLTRMLVRNGHIRVALTLLYVALAAFAATSLTLALDVWLAHSIEIVPTALATCGVVSMTAACLRLAKEAVVALRGEDLEVKFYRAMRERRRATRESAQNSPPEAGVA